MNKKIISILIILILLILIYYVYTKVYIISGNNIEYQETQIDWENYSVYEIELKENLTIDEKGVYSLTGSLDGSITINTDEIVKLVLNGVKIKSLDGPAIYVKSSKNTYIELADDTINEIEDSQTYSDETLGGTIYSENDLTFTGNGKLILTSNYQDGIVSKADLIFEKGIYDIKSTDDAIRGKDSIIVVDGEYNISADGDGIKSTNEKDNNKGYILIKNGTFNIKSITDGIQAEKNLIIENGIFNIMTGGGTYKSDIKETLFLNETDSAKGIKAGNDITIENGQFIFDTLDDSIHSNNDVWVKEGDIVIETEDDGIHADKILTIDSGNINIKKSYEGLEGTSIIINDGIIEIMSNDDGINASSKSISSDKNIPNNNSDCIIQINNGTIYINAIGDGIDSNGNIEMNNGLVIINGPIDNGNAALDYDLNFKINGGTLVASGSSGMSQMPSDNSSIHSVMISFENEIDANTLITIKNNEGIEVITYSSPKKYKNLVVSSSSFSSGNYTIYVGGNSTSNCTYGLYAIGGYSGGNKNQSFMISDINTIVGKMKNENIPRSKNEPRR